MEECCNIDLLGLVGDYFAMDPTFMSLALNLKQRAVDKSTMEDYEGALEDLIMALQFDPQNADIFCELGVVLGHLGNFEKALENFDYAHDYKPCDDEILVFRASVKWMMGDDYGALVDLDNADKLNPNNIEILGKRGELKLSLQAYEGAMEDLDAAYKLDPHDVFILQQRGYAKRMLKDYHSALVDLDKAMELEPDDAFTLCQRGCVKHSLHDYRGAIQDLEKANVFQPNHGFTSRHLGHARSTLGDFEGALKDLNKAHDLDPNSVNTLRSRAFKKRRLHDWQGAIRDMEKAHLLNPADVVTLGKQAALKRHLRDYDGALKDLNKAYDLNRNDVNTLTARATVKRLLNDFQGSLHDLNKAHELEPYNPFILKERVALKVMMRNYSGVLEDLRSAHDLDPDKFTTELQKGLKQRAHKYLKAMANLLHKALHGMTVLGEDDILGVFNLSSRIVYLLESTKIVLQMYIYFTIVVVFKFKYLMGYVERGQWGTYSNGSWEFRATYACIELRLGAYPFQKFREVASNLNRRGRAQHDQNVVHHQPNLSSQVHADIASKRGLHDAMETKFRGIYCRRRRGKQGVRLLFEPRVSSQRHQLSRIYLGEFESLKQAVLMRDVAQFALGKEGPFNVDPRVYIHGLVQPIPKGTSPQQIRKFVEDGAQKVKQSAFEEAYREAFEIAELMAEFGHRPNSYYLHSDQQDFPKVVSHLPCESGDSLRAQAMSSSSRDSFVVLAPHGRNLQDGMSTKDETTNFNVDLDTNASSAHDPINGDPSGFGPLGHHLRSSFENCHQIMHTNEETPGVDSDQNVGPSGSTSSNFPYYGPIPSSNNLWVRRIIIYTPPGTTLFQSDHKLQEFVIAPTMLCVFSTLEVFGAQGWTVVVNSCSTSTECSSIDITRSNHLDDVQEARNCILRIQKIGAAADLTLSPALHAALDKFGRLPGWVTLY